jgi:two-component system response regulator AtoC
MAMPTAMSQSALQSTLEQANSSTAVPPHSLHIAGGGTWRKLLSQVEVAAPHLQCATIEGEEGSGKQTLARCLHALSPFARMPFQHHGAREWLAAGMAAAPMAGFLYLDRLELLSLAEQGHLAEALNKLFDLPRNRACIVISSRTSLQQLASQRRLMPELFLRLALIRFAIPPLRFRREDIAALVQLQLDRSCKRHERQRATLGPGVLACLMQQRWPGNVRELADVIESAVLNAGEGVIRVEDLRLHAPEEVHRREVESVHRSNLDLHTVVRQHVRHVLDLNRGNKLRSARQLGISRSTLYRILGNESVLGQ